jgi:hypothetical protein
MRLGEFVYTTYGNHYFVCSVFVSASSVSTLGASAALWSRVLQARSSRANRISVAAQASLRSGCGLLALGPIIYVGVWARLCSGGRGSSLWTSVCWRSRVLAKGGKLEASVCCGLATTPTNAAGPTTSVGQRCRRSESSPKVSLNGRDSGNNGSPRSKSISNYSQDSTNLACFSRRVEQLADPPSRDIR